MNEMEIANTNDVASPKRKLTDTPYADKKRQAVEICDSQIITGVKFRFQFTDHLFATKLVEQF